MKIGIWLEIPPGAEWKYEGLTRLVRFVFDDIPEGDVAEIWLPNWVDSKDIEEFKKSFRTRPVEVKTVSAKNSILHLLAWHVRRTKQYSRKAYRKQRSLQSVKLKSRHNFIKILNAIASRRMFFSTAFIGLASMFVFSLSYLGENFLLASAAISAVLFVMFSAALFMARLRKAIEARLRKLGSAFLSKLLAPDIIDDAIRKEHKSMAERASAKAGVDIWYIPHAGYKSGVHLSGKKVALFPDYVVSEFEGGFSFADLKRIRINLLHVLRNVNGVITISNHVTTRQLKGELAYSGRSKFIEHGFVSCHKDLGLEEPFPTLKDPLIKAALRSKVRSHIRKLKKERRIGDGISRTIVLPYLLVSSFFEENYIVVSTQNRPYKNTLGVLRAVNRFNLQYPMSRLNVVMTGDSGIDNPERSEIGRFILENGLEFSFVSIPRVPDEVHAALYYCATCAIHGSFFEGGTGTFVFDEAVSVGTPVLVSRNLAHDEAYGAFPEYEMFSYDPGDYRNLTELIASHSSGWDALYEHQRRVGKLKFTRRPWSRCAQEYVDYFRTVSGV